MADKRVDDQVSESGSMSSNNDDDAVVVGRDDITDYNEDNILPESAETQTVIRRWLEPTTYDAENSEYRKHLAAHLPGTGEWLLASPDFQAWRDADADAQGLLWIKGIPGSGKSVVAANLVDRLSKEAPVLYFFFRQIIDANHTPDALLRDWLAQVLPYSPPLQVKLKEYTEKRRQLGTVSMHDLWQHLRMAIEKLPKVYCVVDALDEMDGGNDEFLKSLAELGQWRPSTVKVVVTSRPVVAVERPLRRVPMLHIRLEEKLVDVDIANYVEHRLQSSSIPDSEHAVIKQAVPGRANGLFLYAKLAMDAFLEENADIRQVLQNLPLDLNVMYTDLLRAHARRSGVPDELQLLILSWVTHASRPLRLLEVADMIHATGETEAAGGVRAMKDLVRAACGPLLEILPDETISVIHHSLTEFLNGSTRSSETPAAVSAYDSYPVLDMGSTHDRLALACISYLKAGSLDAVAVADHSAEEENDIEDWFSGRSKPLPDNREVRRKYPFLNYCVDNWHVHARKAERAGQISPALFEALSGLLHGSCFHPLVTLTDLSWKGMTPLLLAANYGLSQFISRLLATTQVDLDQADGRGRTPMLAAAENGHVDVVKILLNGGAKPDEPSGHNGLRPLHLAAENNNGEIVHLLLAAGVDPLTKKASEDPGNWCGNAPRSVGHTAMMYAMLYGHEASARAFLSHLKEEELVSRALSWAAMSGNPTIVEAVLQHPLVNVNAKVRGDTPVFLAGKARDLKSVISLLRAGADPTIMSWWAGDEFAGVGGEGRGSPDSWYYHSARKLDCTGFNALHSICASNQDRSVRTDQFANPELLPECFSLLIQRGIDINAPDEYGLAPIHAAAKWSPELVRQLLRAGADANLLGPGGSTALHSCCGVEMARLLVKDGKADINRKRASDGRTPFLAVAGAANADLMATFAELGADPTAIDDAGNSALHHSLMSMSSWSQDENRKTISILLSAGVPPDIINHKGETCIHVIRDLWRQYRVVEALVAAGADLNVRDNHGQTPLFRFTGSIARESRDEPIETLDKFCALGASIDTVDFQGRNLLFELVSHPDFNVKYMQEFISRGLDAQAVDHEGNTLCHEIVKQHSSLAKLDDYLKLPLSVGVDPDRQNNAGHSALHLLSSGWMPRDFSIFKNKDIKDREGIRPLHIAARTSPDIVTKLLKSGASPTEPTFGGMTPLHAAARFRQPNIVGILLEAITAKLGKKGTASYLNTLDSKKTPSVLHFACQSGLPETVALLLAAGADPNLSSEHVSTPLSWCAQYPAEEALWSSQANSKRDLGPCAMNTLGVKEDDTTRASRYTDKVTTRLEEILDLLRTHGANMVEHKDENGWTNLERAIQNNANDDYTVECLLKLRRRLEGHSPAPAQGSTGLPTAADANKPTDMELYANSLLQDKDKARLKQVYTSVASIHRRAATTRAFIQTEAWNYRPPRRRDWWESVESWPSITSLMKNHEWDLIEQVFQRAPDSPWPNSTYLSILVQNGLDNLVLRVLPPDHFPKWEKEREKAQALQRDEDGECGPTLRDHPLVESCARAVGNVPMLRCLVEKLGCDVNARKIADAKDGGTGRYVMEDGALHVLAEGKHWWQVAEGLPYLISQGADLDLRGKGGETPLLRALGRYSRGPFSNRAARVLIEAGADVNARDDAGNTPLSLAGNDIEMTRSLVKRGATVSPGAIFEAIRMRNTPVLEDLLSAGVDANMREEPSPGPTAERNRWKDIIEDHELTPLYFAAVKNASSTEYSEVGNKENLKDRHMPLIQVLLRHGADPFARFVKLPEIKDNDDTDDNLREECTVIHEIMERGGIVEPFFDLPDLDLEHRDAKGRTLLLSACASQLDPDHAIDDIYIRSSNGFGNSMAPAADSKAGSDKPSLVELLLQRGACITAQDNQQRNALHSLLVHRDPCGYATLKMLASRAPDLVHQTDAAGETPLHYALRRVRPYGGLDNAAVEILLESGADPHLADAQGNTALHRLGMWLAERKLASDDTDKPRELFKRLLSLGLPINGRNAQGETPAFAFMRQQGVYRGRAYITGEEKRQAEGLKILEEAGADFFAVNNAGETLLHAVAATESGRQTGESSDKKVMLERFQWLVQKGLDPMAEDASLRTCLDVAAMAENGPVLELYGRTA